MLYTLNLYNFTLSYILIKLEKEEKMCLKGNHDKFLSWTKSKNMYFFGGEGSGEEKGNFIIVRNVPTDG